MSVYLITYDLHDPGQDYSDLHDAIESYGDFCHILESCWLIDTTDSVSDVRDELKTHIDSNDRLFVFKQSGVWATSFSNDCTDWLHDH